VPIVETEHEEKTEDIGKDETAEMEKDADADADTVSEVSAPSMSWATAADESMTTTFTAQQEPWPPTRSGTPDSGARFSPIEEDHDRENENNNDGDSEKENADEKKVEKEKEDFNDSGSDTDTTADTATARSAPLTSSNATSPPKDKAGRYSPSRPASPDSVPTSIPVSAPSAPSRAPRRSVDVNPFLKRSLGGMLRERDAGKRSVRASADLSAQPVPEAGSPSALHEILTGDEADEEDNAADAPDSERDVAKVEAAEAAPEAEAPTPNPKEAAVPEPAPEPVTEPMTEPAAETLPAPPSEPRRPTVAVGAFSRQLQGFLRGDVAAFTPSAPAPKRGREDDDGDRKRDAIDATPARQSPPSLPSTLVNPSPAPTLVTATDATMEATEAPVDAPAPAAAADDDRAPPIEDPTATKRLKPAAAAFVPKPTATAFVPRPTAPSFAPRLRPQAAPFQLKHRAQTSSISGLRPAAAPFVPGGVPSVPSGGMLFGAPQPEPEKPSVLPEKQQDKQEQEHQHQRGNSLGLFTFTAKLRPTAPAFKPLTEIGADYEPGVGHAAEPLPAPEALVEPAVAAASLDSPVDIKTNGDDHAEPDPEPEVTRRHSFKESLDMQRKRAFHDSGSVDHGRRHSFRASTASIDMQPWRTEASPRGDRDRERERGHAVSEVEEVLEDSYGNAAARESSRHRRKRTSRRASQNSYLSQDMTVKSTPVSPVKTTGGGIAGSPTAIVRSRPIRHDAMPASASASLSVDMWSPPNALGSISERLGSLPMPTSADEFSPIAPVPSDIDDIDPTPGDAFPPATASGGFSFGKLNPAAEPFVFGGKVEPALASAPATFSTFAAQAREPAPAPAAAAPAPDHDVPSPTPTPPGRTEQIELAKETKFRKWTFPSGPAVSPPPPEALQPQSESASSAPADAPIPSPAGFVSPAAEMHGLGGDEESASEDDVEDVEWRTWRRGSGPATPSAPASSTSTEFPMRPTPPRVLAVVNGTSNDTSANGGSGSGDALLLSPQPQIAVGNIEVGGVSDLRAAQEDGSVLHVLHGIQRQLALLSVENEGKAHDSERRLAKAELHTTVTTEALDLIKGKLLLSSCKADNRIHPQAGRAGRYCRSTADAGRAARRDPAAAGGGGARERGQDAGGSAHDGDAEGGPELPDSDDGQVCGTRRRPRVLVLPQGRDGCASRRARRRAQPADRPRARRAAGADAG
jgi:hypothetical protein